MSNYKYREFPFAVRRELISLWKILLPIWFALALQVIVIIVLAIPFWMIWNCVAPIYGAGLLMPVWHHLPYWHVVGLFALPWIVVAVFRTSVEFG